MSGLRKYKLQLIAASIAAWLFCISDYLLDMRAMFDESFYLPFVHLSYGVALYATLVLFAFPFLAMGLSIILKLSKLSYTVPYMWYYLLTVPVIIHTSFIYYYEVVQSLGTQGQGRLLLDNFDQFKNVFGALYFAGLAIISLMLFITVVSNKTVFPRSFCLCNPLVGLAILFALKHFAPDMAELIYPLLVPATFLAILMTIYSLYLLQHPEILATIESKDANLFSRS